MKTTTTPSTCSKLNTITQGARKGLPLSRPWDGIGINTFSRIHRKVPAPQTCIIPELWEAGEEHSVILAGDRGSLPGWLFVPGDTLLDGSPAVLLLPRRATRATQREALFAIRDFYHAQNLMERRRQKAELLGVEVDPG